MWLAPRGRYVWANGHGKTREPLGQGSSRKRLGDAGERLAAEHLRRAGYRVRALNYRCRAGEIDIVAEEAGDSVFVEVKTRRGEGYGLPEEAVTQASQQKLMAAAQTYLEAQGCADASWRVDVVAVALTPAGRAQEIRMYRHAISADRFFFFWIGAQP